MNCFGSKFSSVALVLSDRILLQQLLVSLWGNSFPWLVFQANQMPKDLSIANVLLLARNSAQLTRLDFGRKNLQ